MGQEEIPIEEAEGTVTLVEGLRLERALLRKSRQALLLDKVTDDLAHRFAEDVALMVAESTEEPIAVLIGSNGGDVTAMLSIIDTIKLAQERGVTVIGQVLGRAMSAGFLILQKCNERFMSSHGYLMAHGAWGFTIGDIKDKEATLNWEKAVRDQMARLVAGRNTSEDEKYHDHTFWRKLFTEDTPVFLDAEKALEWGLVDEVD